MMLSISAFALASSLASGGLRAPSPAALCCAPAQDLGDKVYELSVDDLGGGCFRLHYAGANVGVYLGVDGILMVDTGFLNGAPEIEAALADLWEAWWSEHGDESPSEKPAALPLRFVVNTHFHEDHTKGNGYFGLAGAKVIAHESVRRRLIADPSIDDTKVHTPPMDPEGVPSITFERGLTLYFNGGPVEIRHVPFAHTDGDCTVYVPAAGVLFTGDLYNSKTFPFTELMVGARPGRLIEAHEQLLATLPADTKLVPGHGPVTGLEGLQEFADMFADCDRQVREAVVAGKTTLELYNQKIFGEYEERWAPGNEAVCRNFASIFWFCYAPVRQKGLGELDKERAEREAKDGATPPGGSGH